MINQPIIVSPARTGILWIHHRRRPQRFLVSNLQSTFLSTFLSYLAGGLIWCSTNMVEDSPPYLFGRLYV